MHRSQLSQIRRECTDFHSIVPPITLLVPISRSYSRGSEKNQQFAAEQRIMDNYWTLVLFSTAYNMSVYCCFKYRLVTGERSRVNTSEQLLNWTIRACALGCLRVCPDIEQLLIFIVPPTPSARLRPM